jgi:hypothetical protein
MPPIEMTDIAATLSSKVFLVHVKPAVHGLFKKPYLLGWTTFVDSRFVTPLPQSCFVIGTHPRSQCSHHIHGVFPCRSRVSFAVIHVVACLGERASKATP